VEIQIHTNTTNTTKQIPSINISNQALIIELIIGCWLLFGILGNYWYIWLLRIIEESSLLFLKIGQETKKSM
jgi:hypothetical protein